MGTGHQLGACSRALHPSCPGLALEPPSPQPSYCCTSGRFQSVSSMVTQKMPEGVGSGHTVNTYPSARRLLAFPAYARSEGLAIGRTGCLDFSQIACGLTKKRHRSTSVSGTWSPTPSSAHGRLARSQTPDATSVTVSPRKPSGREGKVKTIVRNLRKIVSRSWFPNYLS